MLSLIVMKKLLLNRNVQKCFLPLSCVCLLPLWIMLRREVTPIPFFVKLLGVLAVLFFILNVQLKPWEMERAEKRQREAEEMEARRRASREE